MLSVTLRDPAITVDLREDPAGGALPADWKGKEPVEILVRILGTRPTLCIAAREPKTGQP